MKLSTLKKSNIHDPKISIFKVPYYAAIPNASQQIPTMRKRVIFFGNDFKSYPKSTDRETFARVTNRCLEYVRRHYPGYDLYYKPHPVETDEHTWLNLQGF